MSRHPINLAAWKRFTKHHCHSQEWILDSYPYNIKLKFKCTSRQHAELSFMLRDEALIMIHQMRGEALKCITICTNYCCSRKKLKKECIINHNYHTGCCVGVTLVLAAFCIRCNRAIKSFSRPAKACIISSAWLTSSGAHCCRTFITFKRNIFFS